MQGSTLFFDAILLDQALALLTVAIGNEAKRLEDLAKELSGDAETQMSEAATALRNLEREAKARTTLQRPSDATTSALVVRAMICKQYCDCTAIGVAANAWSSLLQVCKRFGLMQSLEGAVSTLLNLKGY